MNPFHELILEKIQALAGKPIKDEFLENYMGNNHLRYRLRNPAMHTIAREWMRDHRDLAADDLKDVLTSLIEGESSTEKMIAGMIMNYSAKKQRTFDPATFDQWLDHLVGWAEVDTVCTGDFLISQVPSEWTRWKKLIVKLSKSENINKRRASLAIFVSPVSRVRDERLAEEALRRIDKLKSEKHILITKAVSWVLRSMVKHYPKEVSQYIKENADTLPKIAVRETLVKLKTGKKNARGAAPSGLE